MRMWQNKRWLGSLIKCRLGADSLGEDMRYKIRR
jgi:hypothetical protein